jgi:hypothetical protein
MKWEMVSDEAYAVSSSRLATSKASTSRYRPKQDSLHIKEPACYAASFDLVLTQTSKTTVIPPDSILTRSRSPRTLQTPSHVLFSQTSDTQPVDELEAASPAVARCMQRYQGSDSSSVIVSYHGHITFLDTQAMFDTVFKDPKPYVLYDPYRTENPTVMT